MRRISISGLVIVGLMAMGLGFASHAQAAGTLADNGDGTFTVASLLADKEIVVICDSSVNESDCNNGGLLTVLLYITETNGTYGVGSTVRGLDPDSPPNQIPTPLPAGTYTIVLRTSPVTSPLASLLNFTVDGGGGGGGETSSESTAQPATVALLINTVDGSTCRQSSESGFAGTWVKLPSANDCTAPSSRAGSKLLGWATNPNFPVDIAQRQVTNGWGAYETYNNEGQLTAVFIPAGGSTYLSGDGNLFAIWSN